MDFYALGIVLCILMLIFVFYYLVRFFFLPLGKDIAQGFFVGPKLKTLEKSKFKIIKKLKFFHDNKKVRFDYVLVSNYGVFVISKRNVQGIIENAENRTGNVSRYKEHIRFLIDYSAENLKNIEKLKTALPLLKEIKIYSLVVYPDNAEVRLSAEGFAGNLRDMTGFIKNCQTAESEISDNVKDEIYVSLKEKLKHN